MADLVSRKPKADTPEERPADTPEAIALEYHPGAEEIHSEIEAKRAEQSAETAVPEEVDMVPTKVDVSPKTAHAADEPSAPPVEDGPSTPPDASRAPAISAPGEVKEPVAPGVEASPAEVEAEETTAPLAKRRRTAVQVLEQAASKSQMTTETPAVAEGPKSFIDEMTELDAEVDALRRLLAKKLTEQNAQLRKMLARFDTQ